MTTPTPDLLRWYTQAEAAAMCHRSTKTIENLVAQHQIPRRLGWIVRQRKRRRVMLFSLAAVQRLQEITLFRTPRKGGGGQDGSVPPPASAPPASGAPTSGPSSATGQG